MGSIVSGLFGESSEQKAAKRAQQVMEADVRAAEAEREKKLEKQKKEEEIVAQSKAKRRTKSTRNVFTSPLGLENDTLA